MSDDLTPERLGRIANRTFHEVGETRKYGLVEVLNDVARAVAAEVLKDPVGWAKALRLPEPAYTLHADSSPCLQCGLAPGHLPWCPIVLDLDARSSAPFGPGR